MRLLLTPVALTSFFVPFQNHFLVSLILFSITIFTDVLDGYLARSRNLVTKFGTFLDPIADKILIIGYLIALLTYDVFPEWMVVIMVLRDLMVDAFRNYCVSQKIFLRAIPEGKIKAMLQTLAIFMGHLALMGINSQFQLYALAILWLAIFVAYIGMVKIFLEGKKLFKTNE